jgi:hypothetical protein
MELRLAAFATNHLDAFATSRFSYICEDQLRTFARENQRGGTSYSRSGAGNDRAFTVKKFRHGYSPIRMTDAFPLPLQKRVGYL